MQILATSHLQAVGRSRQTYACAQVTLSSSDLIFSCFLRHLHLSSLSGSMFEWLAERQSSSPRAVRWPWSNSPGHRGDSFPHITYPESSLHAALNAIPGLSGLRYRRYSDTARQIKWGIHESEWQKGEKWLRFLGFHSLCLCGTFKFTTV